MIEKEKCQRLRKLEEKEKRIENSKESLEKDEETAKAMLEEYSKKGYINTEREKSS